EPLGDLLGVTVGAEVDEQDAAPRKRLCCERVELGHMGKRFLRRGRARDVDTPSHGPKSLSIRTKYLSVQRPKLRAMPWTATNSEGYRAPAALTTDVVVLTVRDGELLALTVSREGVEPRELPGGFVGPTERAADTALRKLLEKTGVEAPYLEQLGAFAD